MYSHHLEIELKIDRSRKGLLLIWAGEIAGFLILTILTFSLLFAPPSRALIPISPSSKGFFMLLILILYFALILSGLVGSHIYKSNSRHRHQQTLPKTQKNY